MERIIFPPPEQGHTLIELLLVLIIVSTIAAIPMMHWPSSLGLYPAVEQVASDLRYTQALALNRPGGFTFRRVSPQSYAIHNSQGTPIFTASLENATFSNDFFITFAARGIPSAATTITLVSENHNASIQVAAQTGLVTVPW